MTRCGIPELYLAGTPADWNKVRAHAEALLGAVGGLEWWSVHLLPVLDEFVKLSDHVSIGAELSHGNRNFWPHMYHYGNHSGGPKRTDGLMCSSLTLLCVMGASHGIAFLIGMAEMITRRLKLDWPCSIHVRSEKCAQTYPWESPLAVPHSATVRRYWRLTVCAHRSLPSSITSRHEGFLGQRAWCIPGGLHLHTVCVVLPWAGDCCSIHRRLLWCAAGRADRCFVPHDRLGSC